MISSFSQWSVILTHIYQSDDKWVFCFMVLLTHVGIIWQDPFNLDLVSTVQHVDSWCYKSENIVQKRFTWIRFLQDIFNVLTLYLILCSANPGCIIRTITQSLFLYCSDYIQIFIKRNVYILQQFTLFVVPVFFCLQVDYISDVYCSQWVMAPQEALFI